MKNIFATLKGNFYTVIWTACYVFMMWTILAGLFGFDMFSGAAWIRLMHSRLHGFGGLVFGILILAAIPMYIATTTIIIRTKKPLFSIPIPNVVRRAFAPSPTPTAEPDTNTAQDTEQKSPIPEQFDLSPDIPTELRGAFIRARRGTSVQTRRSAFDMANISDNNINTNYSQSGIIQNDIPAENSIPLPDDFDFMDTEPTPAMIPAGGMPNFSEITFDETPSNITPSTPTFATIDTTPTEAPITPPAQTPKIDTPQSDTNTDGEFIISNGMLIAAHTDPDFWIADDTDWFAGGKQRPSPVMAVKNRAAELGLKPVLYLAETNILDLDERIAAWESDGVRVVKDLSELDN
ncbi:hypothetical protein HDR61_04160 [bacterium]|nr:hypothetical protein [bacterium]